ITVHTKFGNYKVEEGIFNVKSYNEFISRIVNALSSSLEKTGIHKLERFPFMQINSAKLASTVDIYIRTKLFNRIFNPLEDHNWRILIMRNSLIVEHIIKEISKAIYEMQNNIVVQDAVVLKHYFSEVESMKVRENYCVPVAKSIYGVISYPSNKGIFEKNFIEFCDCDCEVERFIKIKENYHDFASISYIRQDGMISRYFPDFMIKIKDNIYLVETKAEKDTNNSNVISKKKSALEWVKKTNSINAGERMKCTWHYCLLSDALFYQFKNNGANLEDMLLFAKIKKGDTVDGQIDIFDINE
ncbi:MAG TPA: TnsA endonuclease N-terminal domain-containing protein, partial [Clostridia bacterium]|nr:TnsA endonuclease N-terminal domain-containing protein [Clostridia bacterium]